MSSATCSPAVVAEGIETEAQLRTVRELGCPFGQGYLLQRPIPAEAVLAHLAEHGRWVAASAAVSPSLVGDLDHEAQLRGLLLDREGVALLRGCEAALGREAELVEIDVLRGLLDAPLHVVLVLELGALGGDEAQHDRLALGHEAQRLEVAGGARRPTP